MKLLGLGAVGADEKNVDLKKSDPAAEKIMKEAHLARAQWDAFFPGFSCKLTACVDGKDETGKFAVASDGKLTLDLPIGTSRD